MSDDRRYLIPFRATLLPQIFTDTLVIGGGVAGLRAAVAAHEHGDVIVAAKGGIKDSNTYWAQGGVSVVIDGADSVDDHVKDTVTAGAGLCDEPTVRHVAQSARARIDELVGWGMRLDHVGDKLALGREGGHSHPRIVHADGDATGRELAATLDRHVRSLDRVRLFDHCFVLDLVTLDGSPPQCLGAITHHRKYGLQVVWAKATILATGGCGQVYRESTNPGVSTGDGLAMAYRAGAELADLEFVQFHPTTLYVAGASRSLITEAVRGEGAHLIDRHGHRFMPDYDERGELAPRDIVSRSILRQMAATNHTNVYLDVRHLGAERFAKRFPGIYELLKQFDVDPATQAIPIHPSAHYMVGGVRTDDHGRTNIHGLYAAGEAACTGLHGANRLASNSLLEGLVFGELAGRACAELITSDNAHSPVKVISDIRPSDRSELDLADVRSSLRSVMWRHVGIERQGERLTEVTEMFDFWARYTLDKIFDDRTGWEVQNLLTVGSLITRAAGWRTESRGCHYRLDYPETQDTLRVHDIWKRGEAEPTSVSVAGGGKGSAALAPKG
jgi:L-aspartate oxidase